jgi:hypothetical protein
MAMFSTSTTLTHSLPHSLSDLDPDEVAAPRLESLNLFGARHITSADLQVRVWGIRADDRVR